MIFGNGMPQILRTEKMDREAAAFLRMANPFMGLAGGTDQLERLRRSWSGVAQAMGRKIPLASVIDEEIPGPAGPITIRIYKPDTSADLKPAFLWCHGGGFVVGDLEANDSICRSIARSSGANVVAVRYRMAPEHGLYDGREDFLSALRWVAEYGRDHGIDPQRLAVGGDSAGGNISAAVAQENLRRGGPLVLRQILVYPATNLVEEFPSVAENAEGFMLTADFITSLKGLIDTGLDMTDPWLSPALASPQLLRALPPATVVTAGFDPIRDDGLAYAGMLRRAGVPVELLHYPGQFHGFLNFNSIASAARDAELRIGAALADAFEDGAATDCTLEISDRALRTDSRSRSVLARSMTAATLTGRLTRQWVQEAVHHMSPQTARLTRSMLRPWWLPMAMTRRAVTGFLNSPLAEQTYVTGAISGTICEEDSSA